MSKDSPRTSVLRDNDLIQKGQDDLIRRGDALAAAEAEMRRYGFGLPGGRGDQMQTAINAIPAVQPTVKPLVWESHPMGWIAGAMFGPAYIIDVRVKGRVMFIKGINPSPQFDDLEAAKAAAQADYEARILSALDMQPTVSPELLATTNDVAALLDAAEKVINSYWHSTDGVITGIYDLEAALARVKGETK